MSFRVLVVGRIDDDLREALSGATSRGTLIERGAGDDLAAAVEEARPHLVVVGAGAPGDVAWALDPGPDDGVVPCLAAGGTAATGDLVWPAESGPREAVLRSAMRLARLRRAVLDGTGSGGAFVETLEREFQRALRYRHPLALLVVRPDAAPSAADPAARTLPRFLDALSDAVRPTTRDVDFLSRPSAGELALVLPETEATGAVAAGERILAQARRLLVKGSAGPNDRPPLPFRSTASIGIAEAPGRGAETASDLLSLARRAAAEAAATGGDRIVRAAAR